MINTAITSTSVEWPMADQNPTDFGRRPSAISLRVVFVDRGDVVGVERVPHPEKVSGEAQSDAEDLGTRPVMVWRDEADRRREADHVHHRDHAEQGADLDDIAAVLRRQQTMDGARH